MTDIRLSDAVAHATKGSEGSWEAVLALELAREVESDAPLRDRVAAAKELRVLLAGLEPVEPARDRLDDLARRRQARGAA